MSNVLSLCSCLVSLVSRPRRSRGDRPTGRLAGTASPTVWGAALALALSFGLVSPAWARYKPANWDTLPKFPTMGSAGNTYYVTLTSENYRASGTYTIEEKYQSNCQPKGAIRLGDNVSTVTIWMTEETSITAQGLSSSASSEKYAGGAGIYLPTGKTIVFRCVDNGTAYVYAKGGDGVGAENGASGQEGDTWATRDSGGSGGRGAYAAGAGIGGYGGAAGTGGSYGYDGSHENGTSGGEGGYGGDGYGTIWCYDGVIIEAQPGQNSQTYGNGGASGLGSGGGGGGGGGGLAGASPSIGTAGGGGGGGGGGGCGYCGGGGGGGGGGSGGKGGGGGAKTTGYSPGSNGYASTGSGGGDGGDGGSTNRGGGDGGNGGSCGNSDRTKVKGGFVWCASTDQLKISTSVTGDGCGAASTVTAVPITLEFDPDFIEPSSSNAADTNVLYETNDQGHTLHASAIAPPQPMEGWSFTGYYTETTGGFQVVASDGLVITPKVTFTGSKLYAHFELIPTDPAAGSFKTNAIPYEIVATVTDAPAEQDTYCTWYYRKTGTSDWISFIPSGATRDPLATGDSITVSAEVLPGASPSGLYDFQCRLVTTRRGTGVALTNVCEGAARFNYVRRDPPEYDAETKTLWANGSALKILRDTRDEKSVIVYWDRTWDGACENAFKRGLKLSETGWWVNGGFRDGAENGGGVKIDFVSGEVYGIDAGDNIVEGLREAGKVTLTQGLDAKIGAGGTRNW